MTLLGLPHSGKDTPALAQGCYTIACEAVARRRMRGDDKMKGEGMTTAVFG